MSNVQALAINQITLPDHEHDEAYAAELASLIDKQGQVTPVAVASCDCEGHEYHLIKSEGLHRIKALILLGRSTVKAKIERKNAREPREKVILDILKRVHIAAKFHRQVTDGERNNLIVGTIHELERLKVSPIERAVVVMCVQAMLLKAKPDFRDKITNRFMTSNPRLNKCFDEYGKFVRYDLEGLSNEQLIALALHQQQVGHDVILNQRQLHLDLCQLVAGIPYLTKSKLGELADQFEEAMRRWNLELIQIQDFSLDELDLIATSDAFGRDAYSNL